MCGAWSKHGAFLCQRANGPARTRRSRAVASCVWAPSFLRGSRNLNLSTAKSPPAIGRLSCLLLWHAGKIMMRVPTLCQNAQLGHARSLRRSLLAGGARSEERCKERGATGCTRAVGSSGISRSRRWRRFRPRRGWTTPAATEADTGSREGAGEGVRTAGEVRIRIRTRRGGSPTHIA